jgi:hypothetical protein
VPSEPERPETLTLSAFIARVRQDEALRARFARDPQATLHAFGIDPAPYDLPDRLSDAQLDRLLADWVRGRGRPAPAPKLEKAPSAPAVVYGPAPGPRNRR